MSKPKDDRIKMVPVDSLRPGPICNPPFDPGRKALMERFSEVFSEVHPLTPDAWEEGFRRDLHPDREIIVWLGIARPFVALTEGKDLDLDRKKDIFQVLLLNSFGGGQEYVLQNKPRALSRSRVKEILTCADQIHAEGDFDALDWIMRDYKNPPCQGPSGDGQWVKLSGARSRSLPKRVSPQETPNG